MRAKETRETFGKVRTSSQYYYFLRTNGTIANIFVLCHGTSCKICRKLNIKQPLQNT
jgi:hypothetical protein